MKIIRYKPFFSISVSYTLVSTGVSSHGITINAINSNDEKMGNLKLKPQYKENIATIFYEGMEMPEGVPVTSEPTLEITTDEYFYFGIGLSDKEKIRGLKFHSTPAVARETGFPVLFDASVNAPAGPGVISAREDVKVVLPVFTFAAKVSDTGIVSKYASLEVRDEKNILVNMSISPVEVNDKSIDGIAAVPEFAFSVDASNLEAGIYEFKIGNYKKKYFLTNSSDAINNVSLIRVLKNNFLDYRKSLADNSFVKFDLQIPAA